MTLPDVSRFFHPVLPAKRLRREPVAVCVADRRYVLFRDHEGRPAALDDSCPHRRAPLSLGRVRADGRLACAYHGWNFDRDGNGRSPSQPSLARCNVPAHRVIERHGVLWLAANNVASDALPSLEWPGFAYAGSFDRLFRAPLELVLDNFSEDEHLPYVHGFLGWDEAGAADVEHTCETFDDRTVVSYRGPQRASPWLPFLGLRRGDRFHNEWVTRFDPVHAVFTFHWFDPRTGEERPLVTRTAVFLVPETSATTRMFVFLFVRIAPSLFSVAEPAVRKIALAIGWNEVRADASFVEALSSRSHDLRGMRLGRYDEAVIRNRRLVDTLYYRRGLHVVADGTVQRP